MCRLNVEVRFIKTENQRFLLNAFFEELRPSNSIKVEEDKAILSVTFDEPPKKLIDAIGHCHIISFVYNNVEETNLEEASQISLDELLTNNIKSEKEVTQVDLPNLEEKDVVSHTQEDAPKCTSSEKVPSIALTTETPNIQTNVTSFDVKSLKSKVSLLGQRSKLGDITKLVNMLNSVAQGSTSFEDFVHNVGLELHYAKHLDIFEKVVILYKETGIISLKQLYSKLFKYSAESLRSFDANTHAKLRKYEVTFLVFLQIITQYKDFPFSSDGVSNASSVEVKSTGETDASSVGVQSTGETDAPSVEVQSTGETDALSAEVQSTGETDAPNVEIQSVEKTSATDEKVPSPKKQVIPFPKIGKIEQLLKGMDSSLPIINKVRMIFGTMGLNASDNYNTFLKVTNYAMNQEVITFDCLIENTDTPVEILMEFSQMVNDFIHVFYPKYPLIPLENFLTQLKRWTTLA